MEILAKLVEAGRGNISVTNFTVLARLSDTIRSMKDQVEHITGLPPHHQRIISRGRVLNDRDRLGDHPSLHHKQNPLHIIPVPEHLEARGLNTTMCQTAAAAAHPARAVRSAGPSQPARLVNSSRASKSLEDTLREAEVLMGGPHSTGCEVGSNGGGADASDSAEDSYYDKQAEWLTSGMGCIAAPLSRVCLTAPFSEGRIMRKDAHLSSGDEATAYLLVHGLASLTVIMSSKAGVLPK